MALPKQSDIHDVLISALAELGGEARPRDVYPAVTRRFPELEPSDLAEILRSDGTTNRWTNRIQWARQDLVETGHIDKSQRGVWRLTERGWRRARGEADQADEVTATPEQDTETVVPPSADVEGSLVPVQSRAAAVIENLNRTEHLSSKPEEFETAIAAALAFLGFEAEQVGGSGDTDVVAEAPLGVDRYVVIADGKTTARGRVSEAQINWPAIEEHRERRGADHAVVVGPAFAGGNLLSRAKQFHVTLLTTQQLVTLVELHELTPFTLEELRPVFARGADVDSATLDELRAFGQQISRRWALLSSLIDQIDAWSRLRPDLVLAQPMTLFTSLVNTDDERLHGLTPEEVEDGLAVLSSAALRILRKTSNGSEGLCPDDHACRGPPAAPGTSEDRQRCRRRFPSGIR